MTRKLRFLSSPVGLLNLFCAVTAGLWVVLLAISFSDNTPLILLATGLWLLAACLTLLLVRFLSRRRPAIEHGATATASVGTKPRLGLLIPAVWTLATLIASNQITGYWQSQQRLWTGFVFSARYGWYPEPNLVKRKLLTPHGSYVASTDELGHRNSLPYPADGKLPIVVQGDSHTFGFGLNDDETLAAMLNARLKSPRVYNLGVPGFDLNHYYYQYEDLRRRFHMGTRIIHWNIGNDFTLSALETPNYFRRPYLFVTNGQLQQAAGFQAPFPVQGYGQSFIPPLRQYDKQIQAWAYDWADLYPTALIRVPLTRQLIRTYHPKVCQVVERFVERPPGLELYDPSWMLLKRERWPQPFAQYAQDFPVLLRALKAQNEHLVMCPFPFREQVIALDYAVQRDKLLLAGFTPEDLDPLAFNKFLKKACKDEGIVFIDPTPRFQMVGNPAKLYQAGDQHLSVAGMMLCADALIEAGAVTAESAPDADR